MWFRYKLIAVIVLQSRAERVRLVNVDILFEVRQSLLHANLHYLSLEFEIC